jgi:hypothetical protein
MNAEHGSVKVSALTLSQPVQIRPELSLRFVKGRRFSGRSIPQRIAYCLQSDSVRNIDNEIHAVTRIKLRQDRGTLIGFSPQDTTVITIGRCFRRGPDLSTRLSDD